VTVDPPVAFASDGWLPVASSKARLASVSSSFVMQGSGFIKFVQLRLKVDGRPAGRLTFEVRSVERNTDPLSGRLHERGRLVLKNVVPAGATGTNEYTVRVALDAIAPVTRLGDGRTYWLNVSMKADDPKVGAEVQLATITTVGDTLANNYTTRACLHAATPVKAPAACDWRGHTVVAGARTLAFLPAFEELPHASCFDRRKNGREPALDCGATCSKSCRRGAPCLVDGDCNPHGSVPQLQTVCRKPNTPSGAALNADCGLGGCVCVLKQSDGGLCKGDDDCVSGSCRGFKLSSGTQQAPRCVPVTCGDGLKNGAETDVDCGGNCTARCGALQACKVRRDCDSGLLCAGGACVANNDGASCLKPYQCTSGRCVTSGGKLTCLPKVADFGACSLATDCISKVCLARKCAVPGKDKVFNGLETDLDCGGPTGIQRCASGQKCKATADCAGDLTCGAAGRCGKAGGQSCANAKQCLSGFCVASKCTGVFDDLDARHCTDGARDNDETDVDCGGGACARCAAGFKCADRDDCVSGVCGSKGTCSAATCTDNVQNSPTDSVSKLPVAEVAVDCGGACARCEAGTTVVYGPAVATPQAAAACASGVLSDKYCLDADCTEYEIVCLDPTCWDGVRNGTETGRDCGGPCLPCATARQDCSADGDCTSGLCSGGTCVAPLCVSGADCDSGVCRTPPGVTDKVTKRCVAPSTTDGVRNGVETDADCGGGAGVPGTAPRCRAGKACAVSNDCDQTTAQTCSHGVCAPLSCANDIPDAAKGESETDCGALCGRCPVVAGGDPARQPRCAAATDCASGFCRSAVTTTPGGKPEARCAVPLPNDTLRNGTETDKNCGGVLDAAGTRPEGIAFKACGYGDRCVYDADCGNQYVCLDGRCRFGTCGNTTKAFETAKASPSFTSTDLCGRACSVLCPGNNYCRGDFDCGGYMFGCIDHSCQRQQCVIDGIAYLRGETRPAVGEMPANGCLVCDPLRSVSTWSPLAVDDPCDDGDDAGTHTDLCVDDGGGVTCRGTPFDCAAQEGWDCVESYAGIPDSDLNSCQEDGDCAAGKTCGLYGRCEGNACQKVRLEFGAQCRNATASGGACGGGRCTGVSDACPVGAVMGADVVCRPAADPCDRAEYCPGPGPGGADDTVCPDNGRLEAGDACTFLDENGDPSGTGFCADFSGQRLCVTNVCGNGTVEGTEQCDDGNTGGGDDCSADCMVASATCATANGGCWSAGALKATCTAASTGGRTCTCPSGYAGTGVGADGCRDVDECAGANPCTAGSVCVNSDGSFLCLDPCKSDNGGCDATALCTVVAGAATCSCPTGRTATRTGPSLTCADANECATNNGGCVAGSTCVNAAGGRVCGCPDGRYYSATGCQSIDPGANPASPCAGTAAAPACPAGQTCMVQTSASGVPSKVCVQTPIGRVEVPAPGEEPPPPGSGSGAIFRDIVNLSTLGTGQFQVLDRNDAGTADENVVLRTLDVSSGSVDGGTGWTSLARGQYWDGTTDRVLATVVSDRGSVYPVVVKDYFPSADGTTPTQPSKKVPGLALLPLRGDEDVVFKPLAGLPGCNPRTLSGVRGAPYLPEAEVLGCSNALFLMGADAPAQGRPTCTLTANGENQTLAVGGDVSLDIDHDGNPNTARVKRCYVCTEEVVSGGAAGVVQTFAKTCGALTEDERRAFSRKVQRPGVLVTPAGVDADEDSVASAFRPGIPNATREGGVVDVFSVDTAGRLVRFTGDYVVTVPEGDDEVGRARLTFPASFASSTVAEASAGAWKAFGLAPDGWVYGIGKAVNTRVSGAAPVSYALPDGYVVQDGDWVRFAGTTMAVVPSQGAGRPRTYVRLYSCVAGGCCPLGYRQDASRKCTLDIDECAASAPVAGACTTSDDCGAGWACLSGVCTGSPAACVGLRSGGSGSGFRCERDDDVRAFACRPDDEAPTCVNTVGGYRCAGSYVGGADPGTGGDRPRDGLFRNILNVVPVAADSLPTASTSWRGNPAQPFWVLDAQPDDSATKVWERFLFPRAYATGSGTLPAGTSPVEVDGRLGAWLDAKVRGYLPAGYVKGASAQPPAYLLNWSATNSRTRVAWTRWDSKAPDAPAGTAGVYEQTGTIDRREAAGAAASADVSVRVTGPVYYANAALPPQGVDYWHTPSPGPYTSAAAQAPTWPQLVTIAGKGVRTIKLGKPVKELFLGVVSLNQGARPAAASADWVGNTYRFDRDFTVVSQSAADVPGYFGTVQASFEKLTTGSGASTRYGLKPVAAFGATGDAEFHGVLRFASATAFDTLSWEATADETWNGITVGVVVDPAKDDALTALPADTLTQELKTTWWRASRLGPWAGLQTDTAANWKFTTTGALPIECLALRGVADRFVGCGQKVVDLQTSATLTLSGDATTVLDPDADAFASQAGPTSGTRLLVVADTAGKLLALTTGATAATASVASKVVLDDANPRAWRAFGLTPAEAGVSWAVGAGKAARVGGSRLVVDYALPDGYVVKDGDWVRFSGNVMAVVEDPGTDPSGLRLPRTGVRLYLYVATSGGLQFGRWWVGGAKCASEPATGPVFEPSRIPPGCTVDPTRVPQTLLCLTAGTWTASRIACEAAGGRLAVVRSACDNAQLSRLVSEGMTYSGSRWGGKAAWIGLNQNTSSSPFTWSDGSAPDYEAWAPGEPNNAYGNEDCALLYTMQTSSSEFVGGGRWNDGQCSTNYWGSAEPYLCEAR
jgi:hypothetical protein